MLASGSGKYLGAIAFGRKRITISLGMRIHTVGKCLLVVCLALVLGGCGAADLLPASKVMVQWETATEVNTAGFNLYRSDSRDGTYVKVNTALIPASGNQLTGSSYKFEDSGVQPGRVYFYELEDVETTGRTSRQEPIQVAVSGALVPVGTILFTVAGAVLLLGAVYAWLRLRKQSGKATIEHETT